MDLNEQQKTVVEESIGASTNVTAGAGTGKTRVLVERYLRFVRELDTPPSRILALTFTLKAADEMRRRVYESVGRFDPHLLRQLEESWILNFHSFGYRLIRDNAPAFGIDPGADVATRNDLERIERRLRSRFMAGTIESLPFDFGGDLPSPTKLDHRFGVLLKIVRKCRDEVLDPAHLLDFVCDTDEAGYRAFVESVAAVYEAYRQELKRRRLIDFSDMIAIPARVLASKPRLAKKYADKFDHILVDEFQDTSSAQYELLGLLAGGDYEKVTVVGDEKQAIYRWRDARVENIQTFPGAKKNLSVNYRSRQGYLDLAHALICKDPHFGKEADKLRLSAARKEKTFPIVVFQPEESNGEHRQSHAEAQALAAWVRHLTEGISVPGMPVLVTDGKNGLLRHEDIAVLLRSLKSSSGLPDIEKAFEANGIPYTVVGGANAAESRALEGYCALLSLLLPGDRTRDFLYVLENPPFSLDDRSLMELFAAAENKSCRADVDKTLALASSSVTDEEAAARCNDLKKILEELEACWKTADFRTFLAESLDQSGFFYLLFSLGGTARSAEVLTAEMFSLAHELEKREELFLAVFLSHLRSAIDAKSYGMDKDIDLPPRSVRIMTIHQAKGLEFPAVAVAGIKRPRTDSPGFFVSRSTGLYTTVKESWDRSYKTLEEYENDKRTAEREERCLLYVAITRAMDYLFVSSPLPNGIEKNKKAPLFTDILSCLETGTIAHVLLRSVPEPPAPSVAVKVEADKGEIGRLEQLAAELEAVRGLAAADIGTTPDRAPIRMVNWKALFAYAQCPAQYQYRFLLKTDPLSPETDPIDEKTHEIPAASLPGGVSAVEYGVMVHRLLFERLKESASGGDPEKIVESFGVETGRRAGVLESLSRMAKAFDSSEISRAGSDLRLEEPFQVRRERAVFQGVFDRVERTADGLRVIDYKVGNERGEYSFQVEFYRWALRRISGDDRVGGYICLLRENEVLLRRVEETGVDIEALTAGLDTALQTGVFQATPGRACLSCPYVLICPGAAPE